MRGLTHVPGCLPLNVRMVASSHRPKALESLAELKGELQRFGVSNLWLFGSRARDEGNRESDWDVLVEFDGPPSFGSFMGLKCFLEDRLGGRVDLLSRAACKPRFLEAIKDDLRHVA